MDATLTEIVAALVAIGGLTGASIKFLFDRVSNRQTRLEAKQEAERTRIEAERIRHELKVEQERLRWEKVMQDQLLELRREIRLQEHEIGSLRLLADAYLRHIAALEGLMRAAGITIPILTLPDYRPAIVDAGEVC